MRYPDDGGLDAAEQMAFSDEAEAYANPDPAYRPLPPAGQGTPLNELDDSEWFVISGEGRVFTVHNFKVYVGEEFGDPDDETHQLEHSLEAFDWASVPGVGELKALPVEYSDFPGGYGFEFSSYLTYRVPPQP